MLSEIALRRPAFTDGHKLVLGDGQEWTFPKAILRWHPAPTPAGGFEPKKSPPYGPEFQAKLRELMDSTEETDDAESRRIELRMVLAAELLSRNYDLDEDALAALLPLDYEVDGNFEMWRGVYYILMGLAAPKPTAVG